MYSRVLNNWWGCSNLKGCKIAEKIIVGGLEYEGVGKLVGLKTENRLLK